MRNKIRHILRESISDKDFNDLLREKSTKDDLSFGTITLHGRGIDRVPRIDGDIVEYLNNYKGFYNINLGDNKLTEFPVELLKIKSLQHLYLYNNPISSIPDIVGVHPFRTLDLIGTNVKSLPHEVLHPHGYIRISVPTIPMKELAFANLGNLHLDVPGDGLVFDDISRVYWMQGYAGEFMYYRIQDKPDISIEIYSWDEGPISQMKTVFINNNIREQVSFDPEIVPLVDIFGGDTHMAEKIFELIMSGDDANKELAYTFINNVGDYHTAMKKKRDERKN